MPVIDSETLNLVKPSLKDPEILLSFRFITMKQSNLCIQGKTKKDAIVEACREGYYTHTNRTALSLNYSAIMELLRTINQRPNTF
jgi:hypothetical protein